MPNIKTEKNLGGQLLIRMTMIMPKAINFVWVTIGRQYSVLNVNVLDAL
jgi:hypothetical protein